MVYLFIFFILLLILIPFFRMLPSKRQKEQMAMRRTAMAAGISVKLTSIDDPESPAQQSPPHRVQPSQPPRGRSLRPKLKVVAWQYQCREPQDRTQRLLPKGAWCLQRVSSLSEHQQDMTLTDEWIWLQSPDAASLQPLSTWLKTTLKSLPKDVQQIEVKHAVVAVYWHEQRAGTEQEVIDFLKGCVAITLEGSSE